MIEISSETIQKVEALLTEMPKDAEHILSNAMNAGLLKVKSGASKQVREVYTVQNKAIQKNTNTKIQKTNTKNLSGYIYFSGYKIPLYKFKVTPKSPGVRKQVTATVKKGGGVPFENAFVAQMKSGHIGVFERETSKRFPIEEKMGLAMAQMVANQVAMEKLEKEAQEVINDKVTQEIERLLNNYEE